MNSFQELVVWQKAHFLVLKIYQSSKKFPIDERFGLIAQIRRSSTSICANIAEGHRKTTKDFVRYLGISRASLEETKYHLILAKDLKYISREEYEVFDRTIDEIGRMISGLKRSLLSKS